MVVEKYYRYNKFGICGKVYLRRVCCFNFKQRRVVVCNNEIYFCFNLNC